MTDPVVPTPSPTTTAPRATSATPTAGPSPTGPTATRSTAGEPDWTDQVTDLIVDTVDKVRDNTTGRILQASRVSVHAVVALLLLLPIALLAVIGLVRLITYWVGEVWITYTILGTLFVLVGVLLWSRRRPSTS